jgi:uracil-DNA glycosylase family 4
MKPRSSVPDDCSRCRLSGSRNSIVSGVGPARCAIAFIGEAPGRDEDLRGEPFVGRAGKVLNEALSGLGVPRDDVFITNLVKCRPPGNRRPKKDEKRACHDFLAEEISATDVEVVCALGETVARELFGTEEKMSEMVGREFPVEVFGRKFTGVVAYHPAACLYRRDKLPSFRGAIERGLRAAEML